MTAAIRFDDLTVSYERHPAVHHLTGTIAHGSLTALVGPNGGGKTTLLRAILGLCAEASGSVEVLDLKRTEIAYLPQQAELDRSFPVSVMDVILLGRWARFGSFGGASPGDLEAAQRAMHVVGLEGLASRPISTLSAGQFQRVLFARLLLQDAKLILLDEPFNAIDAKTTADLLELVRRWHAERRTVVCVLHDLEQVRAHFPETLLLARETVAWGPTRETLTAANLLRARAVAEAWDEHADVCKA